MKLMIAGAKCFESFANIAELTRICYIDNLCQISKIESCNKTILKFRTSKKYKCENKNISLCMQKLTKQSK